MDNIPISWDKQICFGSLCGDDVSDGWWIVLRVMVNYLVNMIGRIMLIDGVWVMLMKWGADDHVEDFDVMRSEKKQRLMLGWEQLHVLGYPTWGPGARAARVDPCQILWKQCIKNNLILSQLMSFVLVKFCQNVEQYPIEHFTSPQKVISPTFPRNMWM